MLRLVLVGTSHHHAPIELREQVALDREARAGTGGPAGGGEREAVCLSTCNRTELYLVAADAEQAEQDAAAALASLGPEIEPALYRLAGPSRRRTTSSASPPGLDSLVPGEGEILGQVRAAHDLGTTGPVLDRVFRQALHAGRKVRARDRDRPEPGFGVGGGRRARGAGLRQPGGRSILLLGAGKVSEQAARNLRSRGAEITLVANSKTERDGASPRSSRAWTS